MLGLLVLDTAFPRLPGDVGAAGTFAFPVRHAVVRGAGVEAVVHAPDPALLPHFVAAARTLQDAGCIAIATTCGFLAAWQDALAAQIDVPVLTSALFQLPLVQRTLPRHRCVGVVTYSADALTPAILAAAGAPASTPVAGVDPHGYFARSIRNGADVLDPVHMRDDVVAAARGIVDRHPDIGALVLECANMPPYAQAVARAVARPVFDAVDAITWFYAGVARPAAGTGADAAWPRLPP
ncbi:MAG: aspartate/glutamate racemase family protein [Burkholderiaceae bacterium]